MLLEMSRPNIAASQGWIKSKRVLSFGQIQKLHFVIHTRQGLRGSRVVAEKKVSSTSYQQIYHRASAAARTEAATDKATGGALAKAGPLAGS
jgi:hypothetical protein